MKSSGGEPPIYGSEPRLLRLLLVMFVGLFGPILTIEVVEAFGLTFPITRDETALWLIPKLRADMACLSDFAAADFLQRYPTAYANLTLGLGLFGFLSGYFIFEVTGLIPRELAPDGKGPSVVQPDRGKFFLGALGIGAMGLFRSMVAFYWSVCLRPSTGISFRRVQSGFYSSALFAYLGCLLAGSFFRIALIRRRSAKS